MAKQMDRKLLSKEDHEKAYVVQQAKKVKEAIAADRLAADETLLLGEDTFKASTLRRVCNAAIKWGKAK